MSTSRLGQSKDLEKYWSENVGDQSETDVTVESINYGHVDSLSEVPAYPYPGQLVLTGTFGFRIAGRHGDPFVQTGEYQYRTASGLFLLETPTDLIDPDEVISELNKNLSSTAEIHEAFSLPRDSFWRFLEEADTVEKLTLRGSDGVYDAKHLLQILYYENPVEELRSNPEFQDLRSIDNIKSVIAAVDDSETIKGIQDLNIDVFDTVIDEVEATYWFRGRTAKFWYRRGVLKLDAENPESQEYVIQLFERDVLNPR